MAPKIVYLDQNKWIELNRAVHKLPKGESHRLLAYNLRDAVAQKKVRIPLSSAHIIETVKADDIEHRKRLATVMSDYSQGWMLAPSEYLVPLELSRAIARLFTGQSLERPTALGRGLPFAYGRAESDHPELQKSGMFDSPVGLAVALSAIDTFSDETHRKIVVDEYQQIAIQYAQDVERERTVTAKKRSKDYKKRLYAAHLTYVLQHQMEAALAAYGKSFQDLLRLGKKTLMAFLEDIPCLDVNIELNTARNEFQQKRIDPNDMADIDFLSVAIPYCDIVITERFWVDLARRRKLDEKYKTVMLSDLTGLEHYLVM